MKPWGRQSVTKNLSSSLTEEKYSVIIAISVHPNDLDLNSTRIPKIEFDRKPLFIADYFNNKKRTNQVESAMLDASKVSQPV